MQNRQQEIKQIKQRQPSKQTTGNKATIKKRTTDNQAQQTTGNKATQTTGTGFAGVGVLRREAVLRWAETNVRLKAG
jgi:hypothetical protein